MPDLAGLTVVVTRPVHQAKALCQAIEAEGGLVIPYPVLAIEDLSQSPAFQTRLKDLEQFDLAIFISANAVATTFSSLPKGWPAGLPCAAVGRATAKALQEVGCPHILQAPEPYNSEALLTLAELTEVSGQKIIIFRGEGGRELLADTLQSRGAQVTYAECYRRVRPQSDIGVLSPVWADPSHHVWVVTSNEALQNLVEMVGEKHRQELLNCPLVVMSHRNAQLARELGFRQAARVASYASDDGLLTAIKTWA